MLSRIIISCTCSHFFGGGVDYKQRGSRIFSGGTCLQLKRKTNAKIRCGKFQLYFGTSFFSFKAKVGFFFSLSPFFLCNLSQGQIMSLYSVNTGAGIYLFRTLRLLSQLHTFVLLFTLSPQRRFPAELCLYWPGDSHTMGLPGGNCEVIFGRVSSTVIFCMETATSGQRKCSVSHHLRLVFSDITVRCFCMFSV